MTATRRPPLGVRLLRALRTEPDWAALTAGELERFRDAENRRRSARLTRLVSGFPDRRARIAWQQLTLPDRHLRVRVYRPASPAGEPLPLIVHVHGGGFVGTAVQCDWISSHVAASLPAVVVSVEHRLISPRVPLAAAVDDGWDVLRCVVGDAAQWGVDPRRVAVFGESAGGAVAAMAAIRARDAGLPLRGQVLVNPCTDLTPAALDYPSMTEHADSPMLTVAQMRLFVRLAVPDGSDPQAVSPLRAGDLSGLAPALVVVPLVDPVADQGRAYAGRLREAGTPAQVCEHPGAPHAFLSMPGLVPQARDARARITTFLRQQLAVQPALSE
ncbi:alpha/beta hydrolase fold domain-containing protein [Actinoplanes sp. NPDC024001]|uniref:alpha/beta hydrolase fold domain-containing protein n=1 Tax=Actinoplanes sp. NPDC024001 TaxID=3154598 RepID=UPI0033C316F5